MLKFDAKLKLKIKVPETMNRFDPKFKRAQMFLGSEVLRDSDQYTPMDTGMLRTSGILATDGSNIAYSAPYARKMYYGVGYDFRKDRHPQAQAQWFEKAKAIHGKRWVDETEKMLKGE